MEYLIVLAIVFAAGWFAHAEYLKRKKKPDAETQGGGGGGPIEPK